MGSIDASLLVMQIRDALNSGRTLFGRPVHNFNDLFHAIDRNNNNSIEKTELKRALKRLGVGVHDSQLNPLVHNMLAKTCSVQDTMQPTSKEYVLSGILSLLAKQHHFHMSLRTR